MKVNELLEAIKNDKCDLEEMLQIKKYLPFEEKKNIVNEIISDCIEDVDGVIKIDSVQKYMSYVKHMILTYTNLEYDEATDYDALCSISCGLGDNLLEYIMVLFDSDAKECSRILDMTIGDLMQENSIEFIFGKFLNGINVTLDMLADKLGDKIDGIKIKDIIPKDLDMKKLSKFLGDYIK